MSIFLNNRGNYVVRGPYVHYLDTNGDGTGVANAVGNYSDAGAGATTFLYAPGPGETMQAEKLILHVADKGLFSFDGYGAIASGTVVNGLAVRFRRRGAVVLELTNGEPITNNASMAHLNTDYRLVPFSNNEEASAVSLDATSFGGPLFLHGDLGDQLEVALNDDFSGLSEHHFILYGRR